MHKVNHSEFECLSCQLVVAKVLMQMVKVKKVNDPQNEPIENLSPTKTSNVVEEIGGETKDLSALYSDTSSNGRGFLLLHLE